MNFNTSHIEPSDDDHRPHPPAGLPQGYAAEADLMASLRVAAEALSRIRAVDGPDDLGAVQRWLQSLTPAGQQALNFGLLSICWNCLDHSLDAAFMLQKEVELPAPAETIALCDAVNGDWLRLVDPGTGRTCDYRVTRVQLSRNHQEVTVTFEGVDPITARHDAPAIRTASAKFHPDITA